MQIAAIIKMLQEATASILKTSGNKVSKRNTTYKENQIEILELKNTVNVAYLITKWRFQSRESVNLKIDQ